MRSSRDSIGQHRYGSVHKTERKRWARRVRAGGVCCWRCGGPIAPVEKWDLGHVDEEGRARGLPLRHTEHITCNRATLSHLKQKLEGGRRAPPRQAQEVDRFGGLPDPTPENRVEFWSSHWDVGRFNPRCPDCRERGSACDFALELAREAA